MIAAAAILKSVKRQ